MSSGGFSPGTVIGRAFRVVRPLAQGGMGAVYVAQELATGRTCAVKVMHARLVEDAKNRARFAQEAAVGELIGTEHVVDVFARGVDEATGMPFIAMELLEGETLAGHIWRGGRPNLLPVAEVRAVLDQLATVLEAAHARALVHRDLKPENIFLTGAPHGDAPFTLKLLDFGVARFVDLARPVHNATAAIGTPLWMAPEQHTGGEISPAADVWAVGLIAFQLLTGRFYWMAANQKELSIPMLLQELLFDPLPSASQRAAALGCAHRIPPGFDPWFTRCVAREPQARFPSAVEMRVTLRAALANASDSPSLPAPGPAPTSTPTLAATPLAPMDLPTVAQVELPTVARVDLPTVVHPSAAHRPSLAPPPMRGTDARQGQRPIWLLPALVIALTLLSAGALLALGYLRGTWSDRAEPSDGERRHVPPALPALPSVPPAMSPIPLQPLPIGAFPESVEHTWQGTVEGAPPRSFELVLRRDGRDVHGEVHWLALDGGMRGEPLSGGWDAQKGEMSLATAGRSSRAFHLRVGAAGALTGEVVEGVPPHISSLSAALKSPLVGDAHP